MQISTAKLSAYCPEIKQIRDKVRRQGNTTRPASVDQRQRVKQLGVKGVITAPQYGA